MDTMTPDQLRSARKEMLRGAKTPLFASLRELESIRRTLDTRSNICQCCGLTKFSNFADMTLDRDIRNIKNSIRKLLIESGVPASGLD